MNNIFIILSAGKSSRFNDKLPKQYTKYKGEIMINKSINKALETNIFKKIIVVINKSHKKYLPLIKKTNTIHFINGGKTRSASSLMALKYLKKYNPKNVFIHDAARPNFSVKLLKKLNSFLKKNNAVVPYLISNNSLKYIDTKIEKNLDRDKVYQTQTPQCFDFKYLYKLAILNKKVITDECSLILNANHKVKFIKGEKENYKITFKENDQNNIKFGIGFDIHRLVPNRKFYLGGLKVKSNLGTLGHSDGDPVIHALIDSILGACRMKDIGSNFSDKNAKFKNIRSTILLKEVMNKIHANNFFINNIDINIITETPKINKYREKMISLISKFCNVRKSDINIKGKTTEKLGIIGKEKAIACEVITSVNKYE